jgi:hypothetical protein
MQRRLLASILRVSQEERDDFTQQSVIHQFLAYIYKHHSGVPYQALVLHQKKLNASIDLM